MYNSVSSTEHVTGNPINDDKTEFITFILKLALLPRFSASADDVTIALFIGTHFRLIFPVFRLIFPVPAHSSHQVL